MSKPLHPDCDATADAQRGDKFRKMGVGEDVIHLAIAMDKIQDRVCGGSVDYTSPRSLWDGLVDIMVVAAEGLRNEQA